MKLMLRKNKYVFQVAGPACIGFDGYYTPYQVWRRVWYFPFIYTFFGFCNWSVTDTPQDIVNWIDYIENKRKES